MNTVNEAPMDSDDLMHAAQVARFRRQDRAFHLSTMALAVLVLAALVGTLVALAIQAMPAFEEFGTAFLWTNVWSVPDEEFGALAAIYGTVITSTIALLLAVPISFGIAIFLTETATPYTAPRDFYGQSIMDQLGKGHHLMDR